MGEGRREATCGRALRTAAYLPVGVFVFFMFLLLLVLVMMVVLVVMVVMCCGGFADDGDTWW